MIRENDLLTQSQKNTVNDLITAPSLIIAPSPLKKANTCKKLSFHVCDSWNTFHVIIIL